MNKNVNSNETKKSICAVVYSNLKTAACVGCSVWVTQMHPVSHNESECKHLAKPAILESHKSSPFVSSSNGVPDTFWRAAGARAACLPSGFVTLKNSHNNLFIAGLLNFFFFFNTWTTVNLICRQKIVWMVQMESERGGSISLQILMMLEVWETFISELVSIEQANIREIRLAQQLLIFIWVTHRADCDLLVCAVLGYYLPYLATLYSSNNFTDANGQHLAFWQCTI